MATIRKRGAKWFVQVRRKGAKPQFRTFSMRADAVAWANATEARIEQGLEPIDHRALRDTTLGDLLDRYAAEVSPTKRGVSSETYRLNRLAKTPLGQMTLANLKARDVAAYRDQRLRTVGRSTVRNELSLIRQTLEIARREWSYPLAENPSAFVTLPKPGDARERRLEAGEFDLLDHALGTSRHTLAQPLFRFAVETAMRRGELLSLQWRHVNLERRTAYLPTTKNGKPRTVPLTPKAVSILSSLPGKKEGRVFPISTSALRAAWEDARDATGLTDLHFHDLRHEGVSRFLELGLSVLEVALISGHRDLAMLSRYAHLRPYDLADKLAALAA